MIDLSSLEDVKGLQANLRPLFQGAPGKEVMKFLEQVCGWYDFKDSDTNSILIKHGKRQVLATIKTLLEVSPEQIVALTKEQYNAG
jgi:hypothetical protein